MANLVDYLVRSIPSDIKSTVAFLNGLLAHKVINTRLKLLNALLIRRRKTDSPTPTDPLASMWLPLYSF